MEKKQIKLFIINSNETKQFAAKELKKYLTLITNNQLNIDIKEANSENEEGIYLGLFSDFGLPCEKQSEFDDELHIDIMDLKGRILGVNDRSILFGVYRFLEELGVRWIRHGEHGEFIPKKEVSNVKVLINAKPAYRHRGICIEGAVSIENMLDNVDWAAKLGFNSYFLQFFEPMIFFERWYSHINNPYIKAEHITAEQVKEYRMKIIKEIKKRGMIYQSVGHGWTCAPFGFPATGWHTYSKEIPETTKQNFALLNGKRDLYKGIPLDTELCLSNDGVRANVVNFFIDYIKSNKEIDVVHFWLSDGSNNVCECDNCKKELPSDYYIKLLNELDDALTKENLNTKIVFIIYLNLLWPPKTEKFNNPDRFILMFAPITRSYSVHYEFDGTFEISEYERNKVSFPKNVSENIAYLKEWQRIINTDSFVFEYYFMWDHYKDFGQMNLDRIIYEDIKRLKSFDLNGMVSCQVQRAFLPSGLGSYIMAKTLWDDTIDFDSTVSEYLSGAFGEYDKEILEYLNYLTLTCNPKYLRNEQNVDENALAGFEKAKEKINSMQTILSSGMNAENETVATSFAYLKFYSELILLLLEALILKAKGEDCLKAWEKAKVYAQTNENKVQSVFDICLFYYTLDPFFKNEDHKIIN